MAVLETQLERDITRKWFQEWISRTAVPRRQARPLGVRPRFLKTFLYEKQIQGTSDPPKRSLLRSRKPFLIRSSRFFIFDTSIENMMPKRELQPLRIG